MQYRSQVIRDLDDRICLHIARGSEVASDIIKENNMGTIKAIRNYMIDVLNNGYYDARQLNFAFNMAIIELGINISDLLSADVNVVTIKGTSANTLAKKIG